MSSREDVVRSKGPSDGLVDLSGLLNLLKQPASNQPEVNLNRIQHLLQASARQILLGRQAAGERTLIQALKLALSHPDRHDPLVGETLLQAGQASLERSMRLGPVVSNPTIAAALFREAESIRAAGRWDDPALDLRFKLMQHRLDNPTARKRELTLLKEMDLHMSALKTETVDKAAVSHLAVSTLGFSQFLTAHGGPAVMAMALCQHACFLCAATLGVGSSLTSALRLTHAEYQFERALSLSSRIERSGELGQIVVNIEQALKSYQHTDGPDERLLARMNYLLATAQLTPDLLDLQAAAEAVKRIDDLLEQSEAPDGRMIRQFLSVSDMLERAVRAYLPRENPEAVTEQSQAAEQLRFLTQILERSIEYAERSPQVKRDPEYLGYLYASYIVGQVRLGHYRQILPTVDKFHELPLSPFSSDRINVLYIEHTTCLYAGMYQRAHNAAASIIEITSGLDPARLNINEYVNVRLKLLGKSTEPVLAWGLQLGSEMAPLMSMLSPDLQRPMALMIAQINALAGRLDETTGWLQAFDRQVLIKRNLTFSDHIRQLIENYDGHDYHEEKPEEPSSRDSIDLEEIVVRCTTELMRVEPDQTMIYNAVELFQLMEESGALESVTDPRLKASLPLIEGRFWLLRKDTERARECFMSALKPLERDLPLLHYHQAAILYSIGESWAMEGNYENSDVSLNASQQLFERLPSATIELANVYRRLMLNQEAVGNSVDQALYFDEYHTVIANLSQLPGILAPESVPL